MTQYLRYETFLETRNLPEIGNYIAYGLSCLSLSVSGPIQQFSELNREPDVTTDRHFAEQLAHRFELGQADPIHLRALLEDIL